MAYGKIDPQFAGVAKTFSDRAEKLQQRLDDAEKTLKDAKRDLDDLRRRANVPPQSTNSADVIVPEGTILSDNQESDGEATGTN